MRPLELRRLGVVPYLEALDVQKRLVERRKADEIPDQLIFLEHPPVIIDCLEFNRDLRILDSASELTFLALECERMGAIEIGQLILKKYAEETGDWPSSGLLAFYKSYHACVRAKIAIWHLKDAGIHDRANWIAKANRYLEIVSGIREPATA